MSSTSTGKYAENMVADYLKSQGYKILSQNWKNRWCEIDIIALKKKVIYFVEVKYRKSSNWGDGLDAITPKKQQQMSFAAEMWVHENKWRGDYSLAAASVAGNPPEIQQYIEI